MIDPDDILGSSEVRDMCGRITRATLLYRIERRGFPAAFRVLADGTRLWDRRAVEAWLMREDQHRDSIGRRLTRAPASSPKYLRYPCPTCGVRVGAYCKPDPPLPAGRGAHNSRIQRRTRDQARDREARRTVQ